MTSPIDPQEAPAYTRESVMAYLTAAEAERQRIRLAIADARARTESARRRSARLSSLDQLSAESTWEPVYVDAPPVPTRADWSPIIGDLPVAAVSPPQAHGGRFDLLTRADVGIVSNFDELIGALNAPVNADDGIWIPINAPAVKHG
jgi:hypothetical protein